MVLLVLAVILKMTDPTTEGIEEEKRDKLISRKSPKRRQDRPSHSFTKLSNKSIAQGDPSKFARLVATVVEKTNLCSDLCRDFLVLLLEDPTPKVTNSKSCSATRK